MSVTCFSHFVLFLLSLFIALKVVFMSCKNGGFTILSYFCGFTLFHCLRGHSHVVSMYQFVFFVVSSIHCFILFIVLLISILLSILFHFVLLLTYWYLVLIVHCLQNFPTNFGFIVYKLQWAWRLTCYKYYHFFTCYLGQSLLHTQWAIVSLELGLLWFL